MADPQTEQKNWNDFDEEAAPLANDDTFLLGQASGSGYRLKVSYFLGNMKTAIYDPNGRAADVFDRANHTGFQTIATVTDLQATLDGKELKSAKGAANGYAGLDASGKIPSAQLPPIAISEPFVVTSQAAMLALDAQTGDMAIRTDIRSTFVLRAAPASTLANWIQVVTPEDGVQSINGKAGPNVNLTKDDIGLSEADNTPDSLKPVSTAQQAALNLKEDKSAKGAVNGYASLDGAGKIPSSQLPPLAIKDTFPVNNQAEMLALVAERGDVAVRLDLNSSFILRIEPPTALANWQEILTPDDGVTTVNGKAGPNVNLNKDDIGLDQVANVAPADMPISTLTQEALDEKAGLDGPELEEPTINGYTEGYVETSGAAFSPNLAMGTLFYYDTTGNATVTMPAAVKGKSFTIIMTYGAAHTLAWNGVAIRWPDGTVPTPTSAVGKADIFTFVADALGAWIGMQGGKNH